MEIDSEFSHSKMCIYIYILNYKRVLQYGTCMLFHHFNSIKGKTIGGFVCRIVWFAGIRDLAFFTKGLYVFTDILSVCSIFIDYIVIYIYIHIYIYVCIH